MQLSPLDRWGSLFGLSLDPSYVDYALCFTTVLSYLYYKASSKDSDSSLPSQAKQLPWRRSKQSNKYKILTLISLFLWFIVNNSILSPFVKRVISIIDVTCDVSTATLR